MHLWWYQYLGEIGYFWKSFYQISTFNTLTFLWLPLFYATRDQHASAAVALFDNPRFGISPATRIFSAVVCLHAYHRIGAA